jgi:pimeloyl-ACP methyl ester carboxylesterase
LLQDFVAAYPCELEEIALVGHSMGGLVARSAAHYANALEASWVTKLTHVLCIGSPHFGAPLERAGNVLASVLRFFDTAGTRVPAALINARSAGIKDLRFGYVLDEDWAGKDPDAFLADGSHHAPFVDGVTYGYVAAHVHARREGTWPELLGDMLVQIPSASGEHRDPTRHLPFHLGHLIPGVVHMALTTHPAVYEQLKRFLTECRAREVSLEPCAGTCERGIDGGTRRAEQLADVTDGTAKTSDDSQKTEDKPL